MGNGTPTLAWAMGHPLSHGQWDTHSRMGNGTPTLVDPIWRYSGGCPIWRPTRVGVPSGGPLRWHVGYARPPEPLRARPDAPARASRAHVATACVPATGMRGPALAAARLCFPLPPLPRATRGSHSVDSGGCPIWRPLRWVSHLECIRWVSHLECMEWVGVPSGAPCHLARRVGVPSGATPSGATGGCPIWCDAIWRDGWVSHLVRRHLARRVGVPSGAGAIWCAIWRATSGAISMQSPQRARPGSIGRLADSTMTAALFAAAFDTHLPSPHGYV